MSKLEPYTSVTTLDDGDGSDTTLIFTAHANGREVLPRIELSLVEPTWRQFKLGIEKRAKAPEMVELLRKLEWSDYEGYLDRHCPECQWLEVGGHKPDCALDTLLKALP